VSSQVLPFLCSELGARRLESKPVCHKMWFTGRQRPTTEVRWILSRYDKTHGHPLCHAMHVADRNVPRRVLLQAQNRT
jgi:hypothetical protein